MKKYSLCNFCQSRFPKCEMLRRAKSPDGCFICEGLLSSIGTLASSVQNIARGFEWNFFSVSSSFQKQLFVREQSVMDLFPPEKSNSIKNSANALLAEAIAKSSDKKCDQRNPDAILEFDFINGNVRARPAAIYVFGHYIKLSRKHCQSRWHCSDCGGKGCDSCGGSGQNYPSIEDELGKVIANAFQAESFTLHASGREDVDVQTRGTGRPFVMELLSPKRRYADCSAIEKSLENSAIRAIGMKIVDKHFLDAVCNSHFEKEYSAIVSADRPLTFLDGKKAESLSGKTISQQTPKRVLSRRADIIRKRKIFKIVSRKEENGKLRLTILAEAGTYIKELISSDSGRTVPSISGILGCNAVCEELDVLSIHDGFLETLRAFHSKR